MGAGMRSADGAGGRGMPNKLKQNESRELGEHKMRIKSFIIMVEPSTEPRKGHSNKITIKPRSKFNVENIISVIKFLSVESNFFFGSGEFANGTR